MLKSVDARHDLASDLAHNLLVGVSLLALCAAIWVAIVDANIVACGNPSSRLVGRGKTIGPVTNIPGRVTIYEVAFFKADSTQSFANEPRVSATA